MNEPNVLEVFAHGEYRLFKLMLADITKLDVAVDLLVVSSYGSDISGRSKGTVIHALANSAGISVKQLRADPELNLTQQLGVWVSRETGKPKIRRIMCVEYPQRGEHAERITEQAFRALPIVEARGAVLGTICLPVLGAGSQGLNSEKFVPAIIGGAKWALETLSSAQCVYFVDNDERRYEKLKSAMDQALHRARVTLPKDLRADDIRKQIEMWPKKFEQTDRELAIVLAALRDEVCGDGRASQIGIAARHLREHVIRQVMLPAPAKPHMDDDTVFKELKNRNIAPWVIGYLNLLRAFGNEEAHQGGPATRKRCPPQITDHDLIVCLLTIDRILDFWLQFRGTFNKANSNL